MIAKTWPSPWSVSTNAANATAARTMVVNRSPPRYEVQSVAAEHRDRGGDEQADLRGDRDQPPDPEEQQHDAGRQREAADQGRDLHPQRDLLLLLGDVDVEGAGELAQHAVVVGGERGVLVRREGQRPVRAGRGELVPEGPHPVGAALGLGAVPRGGGGSHRAESTPAEGARSPGAGPG